MGRLGRVAGILVLLVALSLPFAAQLRDAAVRFASYPLDPVVGNAESAGADSLRKRLAGKTALVVSGTRGIGRAIALSLAKSGADVHVVGRSQAGGGAVVKAMGDVAFSSSQSFKAYSHDLFTVKGCNKFVAQLTDEGNAYDYLVFTVGMWPDKGAHSSTADGIDKVIALDVVARFVVLEGVRPLLREGARVMSVLASTLRVPMPPTEDIKAIISGENAQPGFGAMMPASISADAMMHHAAKLYPSFRFIGTHPGIVMTDVIKPSFPGWLADVLALGMKLVASTDEQCGDAHINILTSPNVDNRGASYFNYLQEGRETYPLAYDDAYGTWLWATLLAIARKHG